MGEVLARQAEVLMEIWSLESRQGRPLGDRLEFRGETCTIDSRPFLRAVHNLGDGPWPIADFGTISKTWIELHYDLGTHGSDLADFDATLVFKSLLRVEDTATIIIENGQVMGSMDVDLRQVDFGIPYDLGSAFVRRDGSSMRFRQGH